MAVPELTPPAPRGPLVGKIVATLFLSVFSLAGLGVSWLGVRNGFLNESFAGEDVLVPIVMGAIFVLVSVGMMLAVWLSRRGRAAPSRAVWSEPATGGHSAVPEAGALTGRPMEVKRDAGGIVAVVFLGMFTAVWNGFIGFMAFMMLREGPRPEMLCLTPFVLAGIGLLAGLVHQSLALFNPRPVLTLSTDAVRLGHTLQLRWSWKGRTSAVRRLQVKLVGAESATYRRGTNTVTDRKEFHTDMLVDATEPRAIESGNVPVSIPIDTMHSLSGEAHRIEWKLSVLGEVRFWPDVADDFPITILPVELVEG